MKNILTSIAAVFVAVIFTAAVAQAQETQTTPNVITTTVQQGVPGVQQNWTGFVNTTSTGGGFSGGNVPAYNPTTGQFMFGYSQGTFAYSMAINSALSGSGIQIGGIEYGLTYFNQDMSRGTLSVTADIRSNTNSILQSYSHNLPQTTNGWTQWSQTQTFSNPYSLANLGNATLSFTGKDDRFWAGLYGPQFKDPYLRFNYTADPCVTNPAYSPTCPGFNTVITSGNLLPGTTGTQAYAINQALSLAGAGATIHGFNYGYSYSVAGRQCAVWDLFGLCITGFNYSDAGVATVITDSNNATIYSESNTHNGGNNGTAGTYSKQLRFGSSLPMATLGGFAMSPWTSGNASITNMYSEAVYTPDICISNPLYSPSCPGYAAAYFTQQCTANPLYDSTCPGYAQAFFTQQCTANQLYNPACPGYAAAYLTQQCNANPLYATQCPGYEAAYLQQQCSANPLYSASCTGYQTATTQCSANPLYASYCPNYSTASTQCSSNSLYASYCPGYTTALTTCSTNPLSNTLCSGYTLASTACTNNQLTYSYCPSYTTTLASCGSNPQSNTMCPGYSTTKSTPGSGFATSSRSEPTVAVSSSGKVEATVSKTGDSNVDSVIDRQSTSASPSDTTAAVRLSPSPSSSQSSSGTSSGPVAAPIAAAAAKEEKKEEKKSESSSSTTNTNTASSNTDNKNEPKSNRQALAERRLEAARAKAVEEGKNLAGKMGEAATMEAQIAVQNVVVQAMGFTPGFDAYGRATIPDSVGYRPFEIYKGQRNIDNPAGRRFMTGSDRLHTEMIDQQYNLSR